MRRRRKAAEGNWAPGATLISECTTSDDGTTRSEAAFEARKMPIAPDYCLRFSPAAIQAHWIRIDLQRRRPLLAPWIPIPVRTTLCTLFCTLGLKMCSGQRFASLTGARVCFLFAYFVGRCFLDVAQNLFSGTSALVLHLHPTISQGPRQPGHICMPNSLSLISRILSRKSGGECCALLCGSAQQGIRSSCFLRALLSRISSLPILLNEPIISSRIFEPHI